MLTLFIIPIHGKSSERLINSFNGIDCKIIQLNDDRNFNEKTNTKWKMFMYSDEILSDELKEAIPIFLKEDKYDYFCIYKKTNIISYSPRIFKSKIKLMDDCLLPVKGKYVMETILNGFVL